MRKGVVINRGKIGPNVSGDPFKVGGLLTTGVAVADKLTLGEVYTIFNTDDANSLGLDEDYDIDNNVVVYQHILDFYDEPGNDGLPLWLLIAPQTIGVDPDEETLTIDKLVDPEEEDYAVKLLKAADGAIYKLAVGFNPDAAYTETQTDGMNSDVRLAIAKAQALWEWSLENFKEVNIILEGRAIGGTASAALNLAAIPDSPTGIQMNDKVSICIGQDWEYAETLTGLAQKYAGIGKLLGTACACDLNQDVGEVESFNLTQSARERWRIAALSNHVKVKDAEAQLDTYHTKQYIFADTYAGVSGYRWNGDFVCAPVVIDDQGNMNEHSIALGQTINHASRLLRAKLLPEVRKRKATDPNTGKLATGVIKYFEGLGNEVFEDMSADGHLVAGSTTVNPNSDVQGQKVVAVSFGAVCYSVVAEFEGTINNKARL